MRFTRMALVLSTVILSACGGKTADAAVAAAAPAPVGAITPGLAAPITGKIIEVKMLGDAQGYRYEPSEITANTGDGVKFIMVSGGPHNVAFQAADIPADVRSQLDANFGEDKISELSSNLKMNPDETFVLSLGGIRAGKYPFICTPHIAMGMTGVITVQ